MTAEHRRETAPIPFNRAGLHGRELEYMAEAVASGRTAAGGPFSTRAADLLAELTGAHEVLLTTSCTAALELSALMLDLRPGDTVVVPSFAFTTTALAFARQGARLLFCDIDPVTLGLDPRHLRTLLDDSVRAVVPLHYAGVGCDLDGVSEALAGRPDVTVIEDNAHGLLGTYRGRQLGTFGRFGAQSFHETKNLVCGEGGALLLNDPADVKRARLLYDKGTDRRAFLLGQVDKYSWKDTGSSFGLSDVLAAYLLAQLEQRELVQRRRRALYERYREALAPYAGEDTFTLATIPADRESAYHMFYVLLPDRSRRDRVLDLLRRDGIQATFHYVPLHSSEAGQRFAARASDCPVSEDVSGRLLRLPFYNDLGHGEADRVVEAFLRAAERARPCSDDG